MTDEPVGETEAPVLDVFLSGPLFLDVVFSGLPTPPRPGTEVWASGMGSLPGGIANLAVAASRLGLSTGLATGFGGDVYGRWCWDILSDEAIDLSRSTRIADQHTSVTVSLAYDGDRSMITHGHDLPVSYDELIGDPPPTRAVIIDLDDERARERWWREARAAGAKVFADLGWDPSERWDAGRLAALEDCYAFLPNAGEAMAYTRTDSPQAAARALADRVPLVVVTMGAEGAVAIDSETGEECHVPALDVEAIDPTGAGDVFVAAFARGSLAEWPLAQRLRFAALCSGLAVQEFGGSLAAPGIGDLHDWWQRLDTARAEGDPAAGALHDHYRFLPDVLPARPGRVTRRAEATFALESDL
ncbi:carbohydrate kinase family protein [Georgenia satyanarayanai]|uniref:carbohydrate kinase family protein n=1 Tax=Georgenia satyanarayanai TaxID=860221 RepID=UPI0012657508|nr:carbohydrate kinase family protein [Georgenia satyanarayanai]